MSGKNLKVMDWLFCIYLFLLYSFSKDIFENEDEEDLRTLTYEDLLSFSYQVAKGMEFLSSKHVS